MVKEKKRVNAVKIYLYFLILSIFFIFAVVMVWSLFASPNGNSPHKDLRAQVCRKFSAGSGPGGACDGTYFSGCGGANPDNDRLSCNDGNLEVGTEVRGNVVPNRHIWNVTYYNSSVNDCVGITSVMLCFRWINTRLAGGGAKTCTIYVSNEDGGNFALVNSTCPTAEGQTGGFTCTNTTTFRTWTCTNFFGPVINGSYALFNYSAAGVASDRINFNLDAFFFNVTYEIDTQMPFANISLNKSSGVVLGDVLNFSVNTTDDYALNLGQIIVNDTGFLRFFNFTLSGNKAQFSQNIGVSCGGGCAINFSARVNDTSGNFRVNSTIITVFDNIRPRVNASLNNSEAGRANVVNFTANASDDILLSFCQFVTNMSGIKEYFNFSLSGNNDQCSQNFTISLPKSSVINFTAIINDSFNNINMTQQILTIQNSLSIVSEISIDSPIDLNPGNFAFIECNSTIIDNDNSSDISKANATLFHSDSSMNSQNDNNNHYTNGSCFAYKNSTYESNYTCGFMVQYYANNGTWACNMSAYEQITQSSFLTRIAVINQLMAIEVSPLELDYGKFGPPNISKEVTLNITNLGNIPVNVTLRSITPNESLNYLNLSMICETGNITNFYHRFSPINGTSFGNMQPLNNETLPLKNFTLMQRKDDLQLGNDRNSTFWKLQIPSIQADYCNGTISIGAIQAI